MLEVFYCFPGAKKGFGYVINGKVESTYRQYLDGSIMQSVSNDTLNPRGYAQMFGPMIPFNDTLIEIKKAGE